MQENPTPKIELINIDVRGKKCTAELEITKKILEDFEKFKSFNELVYCTLYQTKPVKEIISTTWTTTRKYKKFDLNKIEYEFNEFAENNNEELCQISKVTCQDTNYIVEYSVHRDYKLNFILKKPMVD